MRPKKRSNGYSRKYAIGLLRQKPIQRTKKPALCPKYDAKVLEPLKAIWLGSEQMCSKRQDFPKTLAEACQKPGWQTHAYCLMRNHFYLLIETPNATHRNKDL
jgi:hypothetical protein